MEFDEISRNLIESLNQVLKNDEHLLIHDLNEPSISHRLALYLTEKFKDFDVDCEYNGNVDDETGKKFINGLKTEVDRKNSEEGLTEEGLPRYRVFPDIIIHRRGKNGSENNILVIEVKKSSNTVGRDWDKEKLTRFTSEGGGNNFNYKFGAFVLFHVKSNLKHDILWYQSGLLFTP